MNDNLNETSNVLPQQLGGRKISENKAHMSKIGRLGGLKVSQDREHMSRISKIGAEKRKLQKQGDTNDRN